MGVQLMFEDYPMLMITDLVLVDVERVKIDVLELNVVVDFLIQYYLTVHIELVYESKKINESYYLT
jgi:hypothetical protein